MTRRVLGPSVASRRTTPLFPRQGSGNGGLLVQKQEIPRDPHTSRESSAGGVSRSKFSHSCME